MQSLKRYALFLATLAALAAAPSPAQDADVLNRLRLAQELESSGDWEHAVSLYEGLYHTDPSNVVFFEGLLRSYTQLKEYRKAIAIAEHRLQSNPRDAVLLSRLAGLYMDSGAESTADSLWRAALATNPRDPHIYNFVAGEMQERRLTDRAVRVYLDGRAAGISPALFADNLAMLYIAQQRADLATAEWLGMLSTSPEQLPFVLSRMGQMFTTSASRQNALGIVKDECRRSPANVPLRRVLSWLYGEEDDFAAALAEEREIDRLTRSAGVELFTFGQRMLQEHADSVAAAAFRDARQSATNRDLSLRSTLGEARAVEEMSAASGRPASPADSLSDQPTFAHAIMLYESAAVKGAPADISAQALYRIGVIRFERFFDLNGALESFDRVRQIPTISPILLDATLRSAEVFVARNDLPEAGKRYGELLRQPVNAYRDQATFRLAELLYFEGRFDSSLTMLGRFTSNLQADQTNDALQLQYFILENNSAAPSALADFARADLLVRQRRFPEALASFTEILRTYALAPLADDATMRVGMLNADLNRPADAIRAYRMVADSMESSIWQDKALVKIADLYQFALHDASATIRTLEELLTRFPNSLFAEQSRKRIRLLRGEAS